MKPEKPRRAKKKKYKLYCYRWVLGFFFCFNNFANQVFYSSFTTIADITMDAYSISIFGYQMETNLMMFAYIIGNFPSNFMIQKLGTRWPIILGVITNILGA